MAPVPVDIAVPPKGREERGRCRSDPGGAAPSMSHLVPERQRTERIDGADQADVAGAATLSTVKSSPALQQPVLGTGEVELGASAGEGAREGCW